MASMAIDEYCVYVYPPKKLEVADTKKVLAWPTPVLPDGRLTIPQCTKLP